MMDRILVEKAKAEDAKDVVNVFNRAREKMRYLPIVHSPEEIEDFFTSLVKMAIFGLQKMKSLVLWK